MLDRTGFAAIVGLAIGFLTRSENTTNPRGQRLQRASGSNRNRGGIRTIACAFLGGLTLTGAPARGDGDWAVCYGEGPATVTPGVNMSPRTVSFSGRIDLAPCISNVPDIRSGTLRLSGVGPEATCLEPNVYGTATVDWSDGSSSAMVFIAGSPPPSLFVIARVTEGRFAGDTVLIPGTTTGDPSKCNTDEGVTEVYFNELDLYF